MLARLIPHFALIGAMFFWSSSFVAIKIALTHGYTPAQVMTFRMLSASLVFFPVLKTIWNTLKAKRHWHIIAIVMFCEPCLYFLFESHALLYTSSSQAGMISAILPVAVSISAIFILHERTTIIAWFGFILAFGGVVVLTALSATSETAPNPFLGNFLECCAMICGALYTVFLKKLTFFYGSIHITAFQAFVGFLFFMPQMLLEQETTIEHFISAGWIPFLMSVFLGLFSSICGYGLYNYGVSRINAGQASAYTNMLPVLSLFMGVWIMGDVFLPTQYLASFVVVLGICLSQYTKNS